MIVRIVVLMFVMAGVARADGIVLESYTGERAADAPRLLGPVLDELSRKKFTAGDGIARQFDTQVSRAALQTSGLPADFAQQVDRGFKAWVSGKFDEAIKTLGPLVDMAHANTGRFAAEPALREPLQKALIALALAHLRIGDQAAMRAAFGELVRSFPDAQVSRAVYGPEAQQAFAEVRKELQSGGRGKLTVKVTDDAAVVFINEAYRAVGSTTAELIPGEYRVIVMANKQPSRAHRIAVAANAEAVIEIDPKFDLAVRTSGFTGLAFANQSERDANEAAFAAKFARSVNASAVAIVGIDEVHGRPAVVGVLVSLQTGREIRRASIPIEPDPSTDRLRALARFLAGEEPEPGLDVLTGGAGGGGGGGSFRDEQPAKPRWGGWRWVTGGLALGAIVTGAVLVGLDGRCSTEPPAGQQCNDLYATATPGYIALGGGAVLAGISIYLFATHKSAPVVQPTSGGATVGFAWQW